MWLCRAFSKYLSTALCNSRVSTIPTRNRTAVGYTNANTSHKVLDYRQPMTQLNIAESATYQHDFDYSFRLEQLRGRLLQILFLTVLFR